MTFANWLLDFKLRRQGFSSQREPLAHRQIHYYYKAGAHPELPPFVLVHGLSANAGHFHEVVGPLSRAGHSMLLLDLPGHGQSSDLTETMTPETLYQAFMEFMNRKLPRPFILIGNSLGGALSWRYASENPERISRLILLSPGVGFEGIDSWNQLREFLDITSHKKARAMLKRTFYRPPFYYPLLSSSVIQAFRRKGIQELLAQSRLEDLHFPDGLTLFPGKTLLSWGRADNFLPRENIENLKKVIGPNVVVEEPEKHGHCPQFDDPKGLALRIREFSGDPP
ncbi:alpha/beta hydrolase [Bdellovibrionota bacterium FG-2]